MWGVSPREVFDTFLVVPENYLDISRLIPKINYAKLLGVLLEGERHVYRKIYRNRGQPPYK